jgi:hypothetical protein
VSSSRELAPRIDEISAETAELAAGVEELEARIAAARERAEDAEAALARFRATNQSFPAVARDAFAHGFALIFFGSLGLFAFVMIAMLSSLPGSCATSFRFSAEGAVVASADRALLAASCEMVIEESGPNRCHATVVCDDRTVYDAQVDCRIEAIVSDDSDGGETTTYWLVASGDDFELREATRTVIVGEARSATRIAQLLTEREGEL